MGSTSTTASYYDRKNSTSQLVIRVYFMGNCEVRKVIQIRKIGLQIKNDLRLHVQRNKEKEFVQSNQLMNEKATSNSYTMPWDKQKAVLKGFFYDHITFLN
jgi:hypothetical protein